jgi:hypothetical protein
MLDDALAVSGPCVDAEREMRPRLLCLFHRPRSRFQSSSASRFTAGARRAHQDRGGNGDSFTTSGVGISIIQTNNS